MDGGRYDAIVIGAGAAGLMCALTAGGRGLRVLVVEHGQVGVAGQRLRVLLPPHLGRTAAVVQHHDLLRAPAGLADARLVRLPDLDPAHDVTAVVALPQVRILVGAEAAAELQPLVRIQRERQQPHHQPLVGLRRMLGQGQRVRRVVVAVHVADLQFDAMDRGVGGHAGACRKRARL